jgi:hypothetical protein
LSFAKYGTAPLCTSIISYAWGSNGDFLARRRVDLRFGPATTLLVLRAPPTELHVSNKSLEETVRSHRGEKREKKKICDKQKPHADHMLLRRCDMSLDGDDGGQVALGQNDRSCAPPLGMSVPSCRWMMDPVME